MESCRSSRRVGSADAALQPGGEGRSGPDGPHPAGRVGHRALAECLARRAKSRGTHGLVFGTTRFGTKVGRPREVGNVLRAIRRVLAEAGLSWAGSHTFRRTVATWMDASGAPLAEIANQLGHADVNTTASYLGRPQAPTRAATVMTLGSSDPLAG